MAITDPFAGSFGVEAIGTSKHRSVRRCDHPSAPNCVRMDALRKLGNLHQLEPAPRSGHSRESLVVPFKTLSQLSLVGRRCQGS